MPQLKSWWCALTIPGALIPLVLSAQMVRTGMAGSALTAPGHESFAHRIPVGPQPRLPAVACPPGDTAELDSILRYAMSVTWMPGMATLVVQDGRVAWSRCYGYAILRDSVPVTDTTCFTLASISKTFTGMALMQLWEAGRFDLDDDINEVLPFPVRHSRFPDSTITCRMLLTHTSGINDNWTVMNRYVTRGRDPDSSLRTFVENYFTPGRPGYDSARNFLQTRAPGQYWSYSNAAYALLGYLVEVLGDSFPVYTRDSIFAPLGMNRTTWFFSDLDTMSVACQYMWDNSNWYRYGYHNGSFFPAAFLKSCTRDLGNYLNMWLALGRHGPLQLLDSATVELMLTPHVWSPLFETYWGLAWFQDVINGDTVWCHSGGWDGVSTYAALSRRDNSGFVALTNGDWVQVGNNLLTMIIPALHGFAARPGIAEGGKPQIPGPGSGPTVVRGVLRISSQLTADGLRPGIELLDASGRRVLMLRPGPNDVSRLAPGVYFVSERSAVGGRRSAVRKVIVTR